MAAAGPHQNVGNFYRIAWRHIPEDGIQ